MIQYDLRIENVNYMYYCILGEKLEDDMKIIVDDVDTNVIIDLFKKGISVELFIEHDEKYVRKEYADLYNLGNVLFNDDIDGSYSKAGMKIKCSNCGGIGHNKKTCISAPKPK
ncbi:hypothetical protein FRX31_029382, partial [Thalictrum thalictroides]